MSLGLGYIRWVSTILVMIIWVVTCHMVTWISGADTDTDTTY